MGLARIHFRNGLERWPARSTPWVVRYGRPNRYGSESTLAPTFYTIPDAIGGHGRNASPLMIHRFCLRKRLLRFHNKPEKTARGIEF